MNRVDNIKIEQPESVKILKFLVIGGINTGVSYSTFVLLTILGVNYLFASVLGYLFAVILSYLLNKRWTFQSEKSTSLTLMSQFVVINLLSMAINIVVLFLLVEYLDCNLYISQATAILFSMFFNFIGYRTIFKKLK